MRGYPRGPRHAGVMTQDSRSRRLRWAVPALVAAGVAAAAITTTSTAGASDQPKLPPKTAAELLAAVQQAHPANLSGTIVETANLGLPNLPTGDAAGTGMSLQSLLTGSHTMRVWYGGPTQQRVAILASMAERDVIHNGRDLWTYTSTTNEVTHSTVPSGSSVADRGAPEVTPQQAADQALQAIDPSTRVTVDSTARVAGRAAYQLALRPRDTRSLIGSVRIAIDAETSVPLRVKVFAAGASKPAIQVGFTDISFSAPNPSVFSFVKPPGATMAGQKPAATGTHGSEAHSTDRPGGPPASGSPSTLGSGWTTVVKMSAGLQTSGSNGDLLRRLSTPVPAGRLIITPLVSVLVTNDGVVYAGSVSGAALQHVVATGHGL